MKRSRIVATSGGFDPLHVGHLRCLQAARKLGDKLIVIVNGDGFLMRKKGYHVMPLGERLELIAAIEGVDAVMSWDDGTPTVCGALEILRPHVFAKGGDRDSAKNVPEAELCKHLGIEVVYGVGGSSKANSSSLLIRKAADHLSGRPL